MKHIRQVTLARRAVAAADGVTEGSSPSTSSDTEAQFLEEGDNLRRESAGLKLSV